jgi:predicted component of type VI protein secretion system
MVQIQILSGKKAGTRWDARRFPVRVGRSRTNDLQLEEDGVWDKHFKINLSRAEGFVLIACPNALVTVNHAPLQTAPLRNGDSIEIGAARLQFWLGDARQRGLRLREWLVWILIVTVCAAQAALIYWLLE